MNTLYSVKKGAKVVYSIIDENTVVEEGATYEGAESEPVSFRVKNLNAIDDSAFTVADIFYGQNPSPTGATAQYGTIEYLYSTEEDGEYTEMTEFSVGTYYVKAVRR